MNRRERECAHALVERNAHIAGSPKSSGGFGAKLEGGVEPVSGRVKWNQKLVHGAKREKHRVLPLRIDRHFCLLPVARMQAQRNRDDARAPLGPRHGPPLLWCFVCFGTDMHPVLGTVKKALDAL